MPESFDSMLAELADAAASAVALPDLASVRRRARQRTVHRRLTASALVVALIGVSGVAVAAINRDPVPSTAAAAPLSDPGATSSPAGTGASSSTAPGIGAATPVPGTSGAADSPSVSGLTTTAFAGLWKADSIASAEYLMVFPDGVVGLSETGGFAFCYGRLWAASLAAVEAKALGETAAAAVSASAGLALPSYPLVNVWCDNFGVDSGLTLTDLKGAAALSLFVPATGGKAAYAQSYSPVIRLKSTNAATDALSMKLSAQMVGTWMSADSEKRSLVVDASGGVSYTAYDSAGKPFTGSGAIDSYSSGGVRAVLDCPPGSKATTPCGVLWFEQGKSTDQVIVYGSYGPEIFTRTG